MARRKKKSELQQISETKLSKEHRRIPIPLIISIIITLVLGGIPFGIGKHIEFNSPGPFDSGAFVYSAKHLLNGAKLGIDEIPSARPGTLIANIIGVKLFGFNDIGPKIVQMILQSIALIFMFITLYTIFGPIAAIIATTVAAIFLSAPVIAKFGNVKEQFMIAFMVYSACSFLLYEFTQKQFWLILCGFFALQPYYYKPTGMSVVFAAILYLFIHNTALRKWKTLWIELALFLCGYTAGLIIPGALYVWQGAVPTLIRSFPPLTILPGAGILMLTAIPLILANMKRNHIASFLHKIPRWIWIAGIIIVIIILVSSQWGRIVKAVGLGKGYTADSWQTINMSKLFPQIMRYYKALCVPIVLSLISILTAAIVWIISLTKKTKPRDLQSGIVWMLAVWWLLDMAFIWVSPRSYEQYYLPLCASGAMLGGYCLWLWSRKLIEAAQKIPWIITGIVAAGILAVLTIPIFTGFRYSPDTGADYVTNYGSKRRGFAESLDRVKQAKQTPYPWQQVGDWIRVHSTDRDTIYVWGWVPGIYVQAQRLAPVPKAYEGNMHTTPPLQLSYQIYALAVKMQENPPKFIVDSRKIHFPNDRPPLELWPHLYSKEKRHGQAIPNNPAFVAEYDKQYKILLAEKFDPREEKYAKLPGLTAWLGRVPPPWTKEMPDEAKRYDAMKPLRDFVMNNYHIVAYYGDHILFEHN